MTTAQPRTPLPPHSMVTQIQSQKSAAGTFANLLSNIRTYDSIVCGKQPLSQHRQQLLELKAQIRTAIPTLEKLGMFELFPPSEWEDGESAGRRLVGRCARDYERRTGLGNSGFESSIVITAHGTWQRPLS